MLCPVPVDQHLQLSKPEIYSSLLEIEGSSWQLSRSPDLGWTNNQYRGDPHLSPVYNAYPSTFLSFSFIHNAKRLLWQSACRSMSARFRVSARYICIAHMEHHTHYHLLQLGPTLSHQRCVYLLVIYREESLVCCAVDKYAASYTRQLLDVEIDQCVPPEWDASS